ncbi:MAG: hypothetical protein NT076_00770 [Candidatus Pacearchaeota archaeon]|nr:hypothetical protein [Candidatus Pacearchaeota archaeon]
MIKKIAKLPKQSRRIPRRVFEGRGGEYLIAEDKKGSIEPTYFNRRKNSDGAVTVQSYSPSHNRVLVIQTTEDPTKLNAHYWYYQVSSRGKIANGYSEFEKGTPIEQQNQTLNLGRGDLTPQGKKELEAVLAA